MEKTYEAYVIFSTQADLPWLKILKKGYRHCAVLINDGTRWLTLDPLSSYMDVTVHDLPPGFNLPLWMEDRGHTIIKAEINRPLKSAPWGLFTCVEAVKRTLGIHDRFIITPWQLFKYLEKPDVIASEAKQSMSDFNIAGLPRQPDRFLAMTI
ncbi:MAG: hypothetical protein KTR28_07345 [Micavibrio sp.]|nr:hypothetical protein [Micavibrio sp.]